MDAPTYPASGALPADINKRLIDGVREFYLGFLSRHLNTDALVTVRADHITKLAIDVNRAELAALASPQVAPAPVPVAQWQMRMADDGIWENIDAEDVEFCRVTRGYQVRALYAAPAPVAPSAQPAFWVRQHPDGVLTGEVLSDAQIEPVRRNSGGWLPLYVGAAPVAPTLAPSFLETVREVVEYHEGQHRFSPLKHSPDPVTRAGWKAQMDAIEAVLDGLPPEPEGESE